MTIAKKILSVVLVLVMVLGMLPAAAVHAAEEEVHEFKLGDVNHDDKINSKDATLILQKSVGILSEDAPFCPICAETSGDGKINAKDATMTLQFSVGNIEEFPDPLAQNIQLTLSVDECAIGYGDVIYVYAAPDGVAENVRLMDAVTGEEVLKLVDDGLYSVSGDDLPNDNVYSGKLELDTSEAKEYSFYATAKGAGTVNSNTAVVKVVSGFTEEQLGQMEVVDAAIHEEIFSAENFEELPMEEKKSLAEESLNSLSEQNLIQGDTIAYDDENGIYTFMYDSGALGAVILEDWESEQNGAEAEEVETAASEETVAVEETVEETEAQTQEMTPEELRYAMWQERLEAEAFHEAEAYYANEVNDDYVEPVGEAIILWSFGQKWDDSSYRKPFYNTLESELDALGLETSIDWDVTVGDYKKLSGYEVVMISGHGAYAKYTVKKTGGPNESKNWSSLLLTEASTRVKDAEYENDLKQFRIGKISVSGGTKYAILPNFFTYYYGSGDLDGSFFFAENCEFRGKDGEMNSDFPNAILNASAESVIGFHNSVMATYCRELMKTYVLGLIEGKTTSTALEDSKDIHGDDDYFAGRESYGPTAYPVFAGDPDATLVSAGLKNGNFEQASTPVAWTQVGDTRILPKLGILEPTSGKRMAILTTGIGSAEKDYMAGTEGSVLSQQFRIPENATKLTFSYNVVSEEPMEWVNSSFDDAFFANLITKSDTIQLATERINSSTWYPIESGANGINFEGGDNTTYHTMWKNVEFDVSAYAGEVVTIQFIVYDVGDSAWDTAALIDNVKVK